MQSNYAVSASASQGLSVTDRLRSSSVCSGWRALLACTQNIPRFCIRIFCAAASYGKVVRFKDDPPGCDLYDHDDRFSSDQVFFSWLQLRASAIRRTTVEVFGKPWRQFSRLCTAAAVKERQDL